MLRFLKAAIAVAAAGASLALTGCSPDLPADKLVERAQQLYQKGDISGAIIPLKNALEKERDNAEARFLLAVINNDFQDGAAAEKELRRVQELQFIKGGWTRAEMGRALLIQRQFKRVLDEIKPATGFEDGAVAAIFALRGRAHLGLNDARAASDALQEAARAQPDNAEVLLLEARLKAATRNMDGAMAALDKLLAARPYHLDALTTKSDLQLLRADLKGALETANGIVKAAPGYMPARANRATTLIRMGRLSDAQKDVDIMRKARVKSPAPMYLQALILYRSGKYREAQAAVQESLKFSAEYPAAQLLFAGINVALGSYVQAERTMAQYVATYPGDIQGRKLYAVVFLEKNDGRRALEILQPLLARKPDGAVLGLAGDASLKTGDFMQAIDYLQRAVKADPDNVEYRTALAMGQLGTGDLDRAITELETATRLGNKATRADVLLALTSLRHKQYDKAMAAVRSLEKKQPKNPLVYNIEGAVHRAQKNAEAARRSFEKALSLQPGFFPAAVNLAVMDMEDKNPAAARKRFESILAQDANHVSAMVMLAELAAGEKKGQQAVDWLERARKASATALEPRVRLTQVYLRSGQPLTAREIAEEGVRANPDNLSALENLGAAQIAAGDVNSAVTTYTRSIAAAPGSPQAHLGLALAQLRLGRRPEAEAALRKAIELRPAFMEAQALLVGLLIETKRTDEASKIARAVRKAQPEAAAGVALEGDVLAAQRKYPDALKAYETAFKLEPAGPLAVKVYMAHVRAGNAAAGEAMLQQWIKDHPDDLSVRMYLADALQQVGRLKQASEQYEHVLGKSRDNVLALNNLAMTYHEMKDPRALETAEKAYKLVPGNVLVMDTLGWILVEQNKAPRGLQLLSKAVEMAPDMSEIRYHWAAALAKSGEKAKARQELEKLLASGAGFKQSKEARALLSQL